MRPAGGAPTGGLASRVRLRRLHLAWRAAQTSPGRGYHYSTSAHTNGQPVVAGWSYQSVAQLGREPDTWTEPMDVARLAPQTSATDATVGQVGAVVDLLPAAGPVPLFVFDAGYDPIAGRRVQTLTRLRRDRVFYPDPGPRGPGPGRPRRHGHRLALAEPATWGRTPAPN